MPRLGTKELLNAKIPLPPLAIQRRIAAKLDRLCDIVAKRKNQLSQLNQLVKSRFVEMFGSPCEIFSRWQTTKLGEIAFVTKLAGFEYSKYIKYKNHGDIIMIRGLNCKKTHLVLDDIYWIDQEISDLLPRSKLSKGDLVFTYVGTVGEVAVVDKDNTYHLAPNVAKIELNDKQANTPYFYAHLLMYLREFVLKFAATTTQSALSMERIRKIPLPMPSSSLQREFAAFVEKVDKLAAAVKRGLEAAERLYRQQMQEFFGEAATKTTKTTETTKTTKTANAGGFSLSGLSTPSQGLNSPVGHCAKGGNANG